MWRLRYAGIFLPHKWNELASVARHCFLATERHRPLAGTSHPAESRKLSWLMTDSGYEEWLLLVLVSTELSVAGVVICLERGADLHMAQLMPLPLTVSCFSKIHIGFIFLITAHPGRPGKRAVKRV